MVKSFLIKRQLKIGNKILCYKEARWIKIIKNKLEIMNKKFMIL